MPFAKIKLVPGVNAEASPTLNSAGWSQGNLIRWFQGYLQRVGGWERLTSSTIAGYGRAMHGYEDLQGNLNLAIGGDSGLQIYSGGTIYNVAFGIQSLVTGVTTVGGTGAIAATNGSTTFTVTDTGYHPAVGTVVTLPITFAAGTNINLGGLTVTVATLPTSTTWTYTSTAATSSQYGPASPRFLTTAGSAIVRVGIGQTTINNYTPVVGQTFAVQQAVVPETSTDTINIPVGTYTITSVVSTTVFDINVGIVQTMTSAGWEGSSTGLYPIQYARTSAPTLVSNWFLDNLGQNLIVSYTNSGIYVWTPPVSSSSTASLVTTAPAINAGTFVAMPQAQVIAFGSEATIGGGVQDPLLVRWSDAGSYLTWMATATNQAGSYRLSRGSRIVGGIQSSQFTLLWTDIDLWSMSYIGAPLVYSFNMLRTGCGLISPKARAIMGTSAFWMGLSNFYVFNGSSAEVVPCTVWDEVFPTIDQDNVSKTWAWANSSFNEIWWFYPVTGGTGEPTNYVKLTVSPQGYLWDYGELDRTCGIDQSVFGQPLACDTNLYIQQHETGYDADGVAMEGAYAMSGYADLADGDQIMLADQIIPDFKWFGSDGIASITIYGQNYPGDPMPVMFGPYTLSDQSFLTPIRARKRQLAWRIDWMARTGYNARLGAFRVRVAPAGKAP